MSKAPTPREAAQIRLSYPPGTRIELELMVDAYAVPPGTRGTVDHVDDAGTIHVRWDCGSGLGIAYGEDSCRKLTEAELAEEADIKNELKKYKNLPEHEYNKKYTELLKSLKKSFTKKCVKKSWVKTTIKIFFIFRVSKN